MVLLEKMLQYIVALIFTNTTKTTLRTGRNLVATKQIETPKLKFKLFLNQASDIDVYLKYNIYLLFKIDIVL